MNFSCIFPRLRSVDSLQKLGFYNLDDDDASNAAAFSLYYANKLFNVIVRNLNSIHIKITVDRSEHNEQNCGGVCYRTCLHTARVIEFIEFFCRSVFNNVPK